MMKKMVQIWRFCNQFGFLTLDLIVVNVSVIETSVNCQLLIRTNLNQDGNKPECDFLIFLHFEISAEE